MNHRWPSPNWALRNKHHTNITDVLNNIHKLSMRNIVCKAASIFFHSKCAIACKEIQGIPTPPPAIFNEYSQSSMADNSIYLRSFLWSDLPKTWIFSTPFETAVCHSVLLQNPTLASFELHSISNHLSLNCLFNHLFRLTATKILKLSITGPSRGESTGNRWIPLTKGQ